MKELIMFTLLENTKIACAALTLVFFVITILFTVSYTQTEDKGDRKLSSTFFILFCLFLSSAIIIPQKKELTYMYVTGKIADNIKNGNLTDKDYKLLNELLDLQKKEEKNE